MTMGSAGEHVAVGRTGGYAAVERTGEYSAFDWAGEYAAVDCKGFDRTGDIITQSADELDARRCMALMSISIGGPMAKGDGDLGGICVGLRGRCDGRDAWEWGGLSGAA